MPVQITAPAFVLKQVLVDPLRAHAKRPFLGRSSGNLFRTPVSPHQTVDLDPVPCRQPPAGLARAAGERQEVGVPRPVTARGAIAAKLARDRRLVRANAAGDLTLVVPGLTQGGDLVSLLTGELVIGFHQGSFDLAVEVPGCYTGSSTHPNQSCTWELNSALFFGEAKKSYLPWVSHPQVFVKYRRRRHKKTRRPSIALLARGWATVSC